MSTPSTKPGNNPGPGNNIAAETHTKQDGNNSSKKRPPDQDGNSLATNAFEEQFSQRRVRRRLERLEKNGTGGEQHTSHVAKGSRDTLATAAKWNEIHRARIMNEQQVGNKVKDERKARKRVLSKANQNLKQQTLPQMMKK